MNRIGIRSWTAGLALASVLCVPFSAQALVPYQNTGSINVAPATCPSSQCRISFPAVPSGKRLVVTSVSAQLGQAANTIVLEGNGVDYFVPKYQLNSDYLAVPVTVYFDARSVPTARMFVPNTNQSTSLIVTLVGYLDPAS